MTLLVASPRQFVALAPFEALLVPMLQFSVALVMRALRRLFRLLTGPVLGAGPPPLVPGPHAVLVQLQLFPNPAPLSSPSIPGLASGLVAEPSVARQVLAAFVLLKLVRAQLRLALMIVTPMFPLAPLARL